MPRLPTADNDDATLRLDTGMHTALIRRIAVSQDGGLLATASHDKTVRLWDVDAGPRPGARLRRTLRPHIGPGDDGKVNAVALAPDGSWCAAGGWFTSAGDEFVCLFDTTTGAITGRIGPLAHAIHDLAVSSDGQRLAIGLGGKGGLRVWQRTCGSWQPGFADMDYADSIDGLAFAPDGRLLATSFDGRLRTYSADGRRLAAVSAPGGRQPMGIAVSPDGTRAAVGYQHTMRVDVLDAASLRLAFSVDTRGLSGGNLAVVAWRADGALAAAGSHGGGTSPIVLWPQGGRGDRRLLPGPSNTVMDLLTHRDGLAYCAFDPAFGLLDREGTASFVATPPMADLRAGRFKNFLVSTDGKRVRFGLGIAGAAPHLIDVGAATLTASPVSPTDLLAADTASLPVEGWNDTDNPRLAGRRLPTRDFEMARSLAILPRRAGFILGTEWRLRSFDAAGRPVWRRPAPGPVWCVNVAREGRLVIAAYGDGTVRWHRASDGIELLALFVHTAWPKFPAKQNAEPRGWIMWTPSGHYLCSQGADQLIGWHVDRGMDRAADFYPAEVLAGNFRKPERIATALEAI